MQQVAAIQEGDDLHSRRQDLSIELGHLLVDTSQSRIGIVALLEQDDTFDHVVVVDDLVVLQPNGLAYLAQADLWPLLDGGNVPDLQGGSVGSLELGLFNVVDVPVEADFTNI